MRKITVFLAMLLFASTASAAITVGTAPTSLVTSTTAQAASSEKAVLEFAMTADASETLSSITVTVNSSNAVSADFSAIKVYMDDGDGSFDSGDTLAGSNTTVNVGSATAVTTASNNTLTGGKYFVVLQTASGWTGADTATVTLAANGIATSSNSPTVTAVTTSTIAADLTCPSLSSAVAVNKDGGTSALEAGDKIVLTFNEATNKPAITTANVNTVLGLNNSHTWLDVLGNLGGASWNDAGTVLTLTLSMNSGIPTVVVGDTVTISGSVIKDAANNSACGSATIIGSFGVVDTTGPALLSAVASNKAGGTDAKEAGDMITLTFDEATNKPAVTASNIASVLALNNSHSWLDGASAIGSAAWSADGKVLTVTLSAGTSVPTVAIGDTVTVTGSVIRDAANNNATGSKAITGSFAGTSTTPGEDDDFGKNCNGGIVNGKLYKVTGSDTVYLAAGCRLKPFRGAAVFHARGHKFQNIITLSSLTGLNVSSEPALPAGGTLVKGSDKTVWFVTNGGKKKGFTSETSFKRLGFEFKAVKQISDSDLNTMSTDAAVTETSTHPEGSIFKCGNSATVFEIKAGKKFPFTNPSAFIDRGHSWDVIATIDCGRFAYSDGSNIQ